MSKQPFISFVLLVSLAIASGSGSAYASAASPAVPATTSIVERSAAGEQALPPGVSTDWWATVQENIRRFQYHVTWQDHTYLPDLPAAYQAPNRAHNLRTYFAPLGIRVVPRAETYPVTIDPLATTYDWSAEINQANAQFGASVSTAGDVNGDGYDDVIVGVPLYDHSETNEGAAFVYLGSATGLDTNFDWWAESRQAGAQLGFSVSTAGDVNGDGYDDVIVGAPLYDDGETNEGGAFVWYGSAGGLGATGTPTNADWSAESNQTSAYLGWSVGTAGDVNGDDFGDVIIGANQYASGPSQGRAFVWYGGSGGLGADGTPVNADWWAESGSSSQFAWSVSTAGDVNNDSYDDIIVGAPLYSNGELREGGAFVWYGSAGGLGATGTPTNAGWIAESNQTQSGEDSPDFGCSVGTAGDVNGDGYDDVIIGASRYINSNDERKGGAFVWHGSAGGLGATGTPTNADWSAESDQANAGFGFSVGTAGDVNGDGYADVIVGADWYTNGQTSEGRAFVYHGSATGLSTTAGWTDEGDQDGARFGFSVGAAGDVNGDGYADVIVGAFLYDNGQADEGRAFVYHGIPVGTPVNWAFLLYLAGDNNLCGYMRRTVVNLESVASNPNLTVLALLDCPYFSTWRYHIQSDGNYIDGVNRWNMGELEMDNQLTLLDFILWARDNYPAKHYYLAVADHGRGTSGIAWDETSGSDEFITVRQLGNVLDAATDSGTDPLDVVHYDACLMGMLENTYQIRDYAAYLIASENLAWSLFGQDLYAAHVTATTTPEQLATVVVDEYNDALVGYPFTISALNLGQAGAVEDAVTALATALRANLNANKNYVSNTRSATQKFDSREYEVINANDEYLDLYDFAQLIQQNHPDVSVKNAAQGVMDAVNTLVVAEHHQSGFHGSYWDLDDAHGVSIYFPPASNGWGYDDYMSHVSFHFTIDGQWDEFLQDYFGLLGLPPENPVDPGLPPMLSVTYIYLPIIVR